MAQTGNYCSLTDVSLGWSFFAICTIIGIAAIIVSSIYAVYKIDDIKSIKKLPARSGIKITVVMHPSKQQSTTVHTV